MKIEAGKYYRMRCGGAVMIEQMTLTNSIIRFTSNVLQWGEKGKSIIGAQEIDLVAEISEAEYSRIVSGEPSGNSEQLEAFNGQSLNFTEAELEEALYTFLGKCETTEKGNITSQGRTFIGVFYIILNEAKKAKENR